MRGRIIARTVVCAVALSLVAAACSRSDSSGGGTTSTTSGAFRGTALYAAPEAARGETYTAQSDIFSLAVVLFELLTLERCFQGESDFSTLEKVRNGTTTLKEINKVTFIEN